MNSEAVREMTFEEEYEILQREKERVFASEHEGCEPPLANCVLRRALRCIRKLQEQQPKVDWIPFEEKEADEDEKEAYGCEYMLCCKLPDEDEEILVTYANGNVGEDIFLRDGYECYLDSGAEFITEAIAWMPKPKPYKKEGAE
jgi:hypothetical protein